MTNQRTYVLLGRAGDILTLLPLLYQDAQNGQRSAIMVAKEYASLFEGVSYCDCIAFDGPMHDLERAHAQACQISSNVVCAQVAGPTEAVKKLSYLPAGRDCAVTDSFEKEHFRCAQRFSEWHNHPPLVFDRRNRQREEELIKQHLPNKKKVILVAAGGHSSPFPFKALLFELLRLKFNRRYDIVDLSVVKAEQLYDLIGLLEHSKVHCLVASDSAPLHLAYATNVPVVALTNDKPNLWYGSAWRKNHVAHIRYHDFTDRFKDLLSSIDQIGKDGCWFSANGAKRIIHVWNQYEVDDNNRERHLDAVRNWNSIYANRIGVADWISTPIEIGAVGQDSKTVLKDRFRFPLLKDAVRLAIQRARIDDVICITRCDVQFSENAKEKLLTSIIDCGAVYSRRTLISPEGPQYHPAVDLLAFTKEWWHKHSDELPNFLMAIDPFWHRTFSELIHKHGGKDVPELTFRNTSPPVKIEGDAPKFYSYNDTEATKWREANPDPNTVKKVIEQLPSVSVNRRALSPLGYNPSVAQLDGKIIIAYRWHSQNDATTTLALAELDKEWNVTSNNQIRLPGNSCEDPRFFYHQNKLWLCYVESKIGTGSFNAIVKYGVLERDKEWTVKGALQPKIGRNDGTATEKNWVFFDRGGKLYCLYQSRPEQVVYEIQGNEAVAEYKSPLVAWKWGNISGDCIVPYGDNLLRIFHTHMNNEPPPCHWRYYVGAALMESKPPFKTIAVSKSPILRGSFEDNLTDTEKFSCHHRKDNVVFPCGCIATDGGWLLSVGVNDVECALVKLTPGDLNL